MNIEQKCSYCGASYGTTEARDNDSLVAQLGVSHGACPDCAERMMAELDCELALQPVVPTGKS